MIDVRTATVADIPAIQRVARVSWERAYGDFHLLQFGGVRLDDWYGEETLERAPVETLGPPTDP